MKITRWDILSVIALLGACLFLAVVVQIFNNPNSWLNPFPPPPIPATLVVPTQEPTQFQLPLTWTPTPPSQIKDQATPKLTATPIPTDTLFVMPASTSTRTPTITPKVTIKPTK